MSVRTIIEGACRLALAEIDFAVAVYFAGPSMKRKERYVVRLDEVAITREGDSADRD